MKKPKFFKLLSKLAVPCTEQEWMLWFGSADRQVAFDKVGPLEVSTVFLGLDHRHVGPGDPLLFETMVFGFPDNDGGWTTRYATWGEAEQGHAVTVQAARELVEAADKAITRNE